MSAKRYKIKATCFDKRKRVISVGYNSYKKTHPLMLFFAMQAEKNSQKICLPAELAALLKAKDKEIHTMLVERIESNGYGLAKPCLACQCAIKAYGVKFVQYTTEEGVNEYEVV